MFVDREINKNQRTRTKASCWEDCLSSAATNTDTADDKEKVTVSVRRLRDTKHCLFGR